MYSWNTHIPDLSSKQGKRQDGERAHSSFNAALQAVLDCKLTIFNKVKTL